MNKVASKLRSRRALGRSVRGNDNNDNDDDDDDEQIMVSQEGPWPFGQTPEVSRADFTDLPTFRFIFLGSSRNFSQILLLLLSMVNCCSFDMFSGQFSAFLKTNIVSKLKAVWSGVMHAD